MPKCSSPETNPLNVPRTVQTYDALPDAGPWAASVPNVWAPNVVINNWGFYVMYYSAASASNPAQHCIGVAVASSINGPYIPHSTPFACPIAQGGAIDASGFHDTDGSRYVVYKVDGGSIGHGGACSNGVAPIVPTPIMLQQVDSNDAFTPVGSPVQILTNIAADGSGVEAPALTKSGNTYVLFYSSNCYTTSAYTISYAMSTSLTSAFTRYGNLATTGTDGLTAPGGAHVNFDGTHMVFHANNGNGGRSMWDATISINTQTHTVTAN